MRKHWPLLRVLLASWFSYAIAAVVNLDGFSGITFSAAVLWVAASMAYTHGFEWWYHNRVMHIMASEIPRHPGILRRLVHKIRQKHINHHSVFCGESFRRHDKEAAREVISPWIMFPLLFAVHYLFFSAFLSAERLLPLFFGITLHYSLFEAIHWFTHIDGTFFDRFICGMLRGPMGHHRDHHEIASRNFNFMPPYLGDRVGGTYRVSSGKENK